MQQLLIFDVDGTLVHSERRDSRAFARTYEDLYRKPFPTIDWHQFPHVTDHTILSTVILQHFGRPVEAEEFGRFQDYYLALLRQNRLEGPHYYKEVPGAAQTIRQLLADDRFAVAIATGGWSAPARIKLEHIGIPTEQLTIAGADGKPTRNEILQEAIRQHNWQSDAWDRIVYIGDALWDVQTTRQMALRFLGVRFRKDIQVLLEAGARQVLFDFTDYEAFVESVQAAQPPVEL